MKVCTCCKVAKDRSEFYAHPNSLDGLQSQCKTCIRVSTKVRRKAYRRVALDSPVEIAMETASVTVTRVL